MYIKRLRGKTLKETVNAIKAEFGIEPLILSSRRIGPGVFEVIGAVDYDRERKAHVKAPEPVGGKGTGAVVKPVAPRLREGGGKPRKG
jgi:flagellar biosynthesis GTPase FlhF